MTDNLKYEINFDKETLLLIKLEEDNFDFEDCIPFIKSLQVQKGDESFILYPKDGEVKFSDDTEWLDEGLSLIHI